jgi:glycosyltransferase involved in cell wall biosynthesis
VYIKTTNPDCIVVSAQGTSIIVLCAKVLGCINQPVIVYVHQSIRETDTMYNRLLIKLLYRYADGFLCVSKGIETEILQEIKGAQGKTGTAYNTLSSKKERTLSEEDTAFCMSLAQPVYMTASRLEKIKGVDILVDIFIQYLESHPGTLLIVGDGGLRKDVENKIAQHDLKKRIICIGYKDNPRQYMAHAQVYVSCARSEAFGISLIEALSEGVAVIATDVPYGPQEICDVQGGLPVEYPLVGNYGILFSDVVEIDTMTTRFTQAITKLNDSPFEQDVLKQRALSFSKEEQVKEFDKLIRRVLENPRI